MREKGKAEAGCGREEKKEVKSEREGKKKSDLGWIILTGLSADAYSQALSHYCQARALLSAAFLPWTGSNLIMQPGRVRLPPTRPC